MKYKYVILIVVIGFLALFIKAYIDSSKTKEQPIVETQAVNSQYESWKDETVSEIGLKLKIPSDTTLRKEVADNAGKLFRVGIYVEKDSYQLYGLFQADKDATIDDLERAKQAPDMTEVKDVEINGLKGFEGLITGPKTRHITTFLVKGRLFSVSTIPPTKENKELTDKILATFSFE